MLVDGNALVREWVDAGDFATEGGVELVAMGQAVGLGYRRDGIRVAGEIQCNWLERRAGFATCAELRGRCLFHLVQAGECEPARRGLAGLPTQYGQRRNVQALGELLLR